MFALNIHTIQEVPNDSNGNPLVTKLIADVVHADLPKSEYKLLKSQEEMSSTILKLSKSKHSRCLLKKHTAPKR